ncbi:MAG: hypothetical protein WC378_15605 [Opitutaceae bacterium]|jgi:hypothetical protein
MLTIIIVISFAAAFTLLGIFIAANNPDLAQKFKTRGTKLLDAAKREAEALEAQWRQ